MAARAAARGAYRGEGPEPHRCVRRWCALLLLPVSREGSALLALLSSLLLRHVDARRVRSRCSRREHPAAPERVPRPCDPAANRPEGAQAPPPPLRVRQGVAVILQWLRCVLRRAQGTSRLRVALSAAHTDKDIEDLASALIECGVVGRGASAKAKKSTGATAGFEAITSKL